MKQLSIKSKLRVMLVIVIIVAVIMGIAGAVGVISMRDSEKQLYQIAHNNNNSNTLIAVILELRIQLRNAIANVHNPDELQTILTALYDCENQMDLLINSLEHGVITQEGKDKIQEFIELNANLKPARQDFYNMALIGDVQSLNDWLIKYTDDAYRLQNLCIDIKNIGLTNAEQMLQDDIAMSFRLLSISLFVFAACILAAYLLYKHISKLITTPIGQIVTAAEKIALGDTDVSFHIDSNDEFEELILAFKTMADAIRTQANIVNALAEGDFTISINPRSEHDILNQSVEKLIHSNNQLLMEVKAASDQVEFGSEHIAQAAQDLATGASEQAASIEEFSEALNQVAKQTDYNAQCAKENLKVAVRAGSLMEDGSRSMDKMLISMDSINKSSQGVAQIIKVIEDLSFQTNLLSLNASVEAARAGHYGKGFAVVADEVRNLAAKSAAAAKETAILIENCLSQVKEGNTIVEYTNQCLESISTCREEHMQLSKELAKISENQAILINEIKEGIKQISEVVQSNSATAEESASAAEEMFAQTQILQETVNRFKLQKEDILPHENIHYNKPLNDKRNGNTDHYASPSISSESDYALARQGGSSKYF